MTIEAEVAALTQATTDLLDAVNVQKTALDASVTAAGTSETNAAAAAAAAAADQATVAADKALVANYKAETEAARDAAVAVVYEGEASITPGPGKIPVADANGRIRSDWLYAVNDIGAPGGLGFGVGICPAPPEGFTLMDGGYSPSSDNYGNYQYTDGSIMCWIPAFYYRIGHASNPTYAAYGVNSIDVRPLSAFLNLAQANAAGYALHRAFYDGAATQLGFFVDKFQCSNNSGTASSLQNGNPLTARADHNPFSGLTGAPANILGSAFAVAKTRGARFFPSMLYMYSALALLATAHAQASTSTARCAWYDATNNFPKGNNNNALKDANDTAVTYTSDGYQNCGKTGSGDPFAKTTHNGQACGVADLNGNVWEIAPGLTCIAADKAITAATQANPVALTVAGHGRTTGDTVMLTSVTGMTEINDRLYTVTVVDPDTLTLDGCDGTAFSAFISGTLTAGTFYALDTSATAADLTGGNTLATDAFGATGVAAHSSPIAMPFLTVHGINGYTARYGNSAEQVISGALDGDDWMRAGLGIPLSAAISSAGTTLFGQDYYYQYIKTELCPRVGGLWNDGSTAGVWALSLLLARADSNPASGVRAASYL